MRKRFLAPLFLLLAFFSCKSFIYSDPAEREVIYFQPNTTQIFTELYQAYGLLNPPQKTFFEDAFYLDQSIPPKTLPLQPSNQVIFEHASQVLSAFHKRVGDLELYIDPAKPKPFFFTASGSKHLLVAMAYAISMSEPEKKFLFVEQAPFYSGHPNAVSGLFKYPNARFLAFHDPLEIQLEPGEVLVEFVTSPNNPDGKFRKPLTDAQIIIADFVFASSSFGDDGTGYTDANIAWVRKARKEGKHVFSINSASKQFGKTGARCGYIWYPMDDFYANFIFDKFFGFISSSTVGGGTAGLEEFLNLIKAFLELPDTGKALRQDANRSLIKRHQLVEKELLRRYPGSKVISIAGSPTFFARINTSHTPKKEAWEVIFEDFGAVVNRGEPMGETNEFIRLNLSGYSSQLAEFLNRLVGSNQYKEQDLLIVSSKACLSRVVCAKDLENLVYTVKPNDCQIVVDAKENPFEVHLPPFIGYGQSKEIVIIKADSSPNPVSIKAENISLTLEKEGAQVIVQWMQTLNFQGFWKIVEGYSEKSSAVNS